MDWLKKDKDLGLPTYNAQGLEIRSGERYVLLSIEGDILDRATYTLIGYEADKSLAVMADATGFEFKVKIDGLGTLSRNQNSPYKRDTWTTKIPEDTRTSDEALPVLEKPKPKKDLKEQNWDRRYNRMLLRLDLSNKDIAEITGGSLHYLETLHKSNRKRATGFKLAVHIFELLSDVKTDK